MKGRGVEMNRGYFLTESDVKSQLPEKIYQIYCRISDDISKRIFTNCILHSMTNDVRYIRDSILFSPVGEKFDRLLTQAGHEPIYIYGAGKRGKELFELFPDKNWGGYIDQNKEGNCNGLPIVKLEQISVHSDIHIVVSNQMGYGEIVRELIEYGIEKDRIITCEDLNSEMMACMYFDKRCINRNRISGGFIDAGSYDGKDSKQFMEWSGNYACKIWAFEPDIKQYKVCRKNLGEYENVQVMRAGVSDKSGNAKMIMLHSGLSHIDEEGEEITTVALDDVLAREHVGYIKMDIEGFEQKALKGAENIIRNQFPALAISVYHSREDIWRIPGLLLDYNPQYRFCFGHYQIVHADTVVYAY